MTYKEAVEYLYNATPQFQQIGAAAYKPGLDTVRRLSRLNGESHKKYPTIHIAGTNGKGSTAHTIAAVMQSAGYRVGLFTSPHLIDFRERIRVNGDMIPESEVVLRLEKYLRDTAENSISPSFFELTTVMAFDWFAKAGVDIAVIEVGLGGRLDSTNIITPVLSVITNISFDHTAQLGNTLSAIASEKAGIIKPGIPVVLGEGDIPEVREVIVDKANEAAAPVFIASDNIPFDKAVRSLEETTYIGTPFGNTVKAALSGHCQTRNAATIFTALLQLRKAGYNITDEAVARGFARVCDMTGLAGRWMRLSDSPLTIADTGHNIGGWQYLAPALESWQHGKLRCILGFVNDKDISSILSLLPRDAVYYFTRASVPRALDPETLQCIAAGNGIDGTIWPDVASAITAARADASPRDLIFIGGSTFVVADAIDSLR